MPEARVIPLRGDGPRPRPRPSPRRATTPEIVLPSVDEVPGAEPAEPPATDLEARVTEVAEFLRRRLAGRYAVDDFGFDPDLTDHVVMPLLRPLYERWFRVETIGTANVPSVGGALLVALHLLAEFGVLAMLRFPTFTTAILDQYEAAFDTATRLARETHTHVTVHLQRQTLAQTKHVTTKSGSSVAVLHSHSAMRCPSVFYDHDPARSPASNL